MKSFNETCEDVLASIITEGGNAIANVDRIKRKYIDKTVESFKNTILIPYLGYDPGDSMFLLGSTGKKKDSGDIDIGLSLDALKDKNILVNLLKLNEACAKNGFNSCVNTINYNMLHVAYPQKGNATKLVQIDLLITNAPEFTKFFMFSPTEDESKYKGAHRNALLRSILKTISFKPTQFDVNGDPVKWEQVDLTDMGMFKQHKSLVDANGHRLLYKNTDEPLEFIYAKVEQETLISNDVKTVISYIVGDKFKEEDISSFEKLFKIVKSNKKFKYAGVSSKILQECAEILSQSTNRLDFPEELNSYLKK